MDKILRVEMLTLRVEWEKVPHDYVTLGGKGLTSRIVFEEMKPSCDPLGVFEKLVLAPGLCRNLPRALDARARDIDEEMKLPAAHVNSLDADHHSPIESHHRNSDITGSISSSGSSRE